jgi:hypothetical protein
MNNDYEDEADPEIPIPTGAYDTAREADQTAPTGDRLREVDDD